MVATSGVSAGRSKRRGKLAFRKEAPCGCLLAGVRVELFATECGNILNLLLLAAAAGVLFWLAWKKAVLELRSVVLSPEIAVCCVAVVCIRSSLPRKTTQAEAFSVCVECFVLVFVMSGLLHMRCGRLGSPSS